MWVIHKKEQGEMKSIKYDMEYCTADMFHEHKIDPAPHDVERNRLCPKILHEDINYFV